MSWIYIIGAENGPYKIGFSKTPETRLKSLQTGHPNKLILHYKREVPEEEIKFIEECIHKQMKPKQTHGEWFNVILDDAKSEISFAIIKHSRSQ